MHDHRVGILKHQSMFNTILHKATADRQQSGRFADNHQMVIHIHYADFLKAWFRQVLSEVTHKFSYSRWL